MLRAPFCAPALLAFVGGGTAEFFEEDLFVTLCEERFRLLSFRWFARELGVEFDEERFFELVGFLITVVGVPKRRGLPIFDCRLPIVTERR